MELIFILIAGYLWYLFTKLNERVENLERRLGVEDKTKVVTPLYGTYTTPAPTAVPSPVYAEPASDFVHPDVQPAIVQSGAYETQLVSGIDNFFIWLKKDFLMKLGALFLLMGMGWFVSYAFMNNWIGPVGRISLGLLTGVCILILGAWRIRSYEHQGSVFTVLGSGTVLLTVFAARAMYGFFTPASALVLMFTTVVFVAFVSVKYRRNSLALAGLIIAGIAPYLTFSPVPLVIEQFMYLFVIVLGTLWVVYFTGWRNLTLTALIIVFLETLPFIGHSGDSVIVLMWVFLFVAIFFVANIISIIRVAGMALSSAHLFTAYGTALFLVLWVFVVASEEWQSLIFVAWMLVFSFGSYIVFKTTAERTPFYVYGGTAITLLGAATAAELSGAVLTIAYTLEVAVLIIVALALRFGQEVITSLSILFVIPVVMSVGHIMSPAWNTGVLHPEFFVLAILTLVFLILGLFMHERVRMGAGNTETKQLSTIFLMTGVTYLFILTALVNTGLFPKSSSFGTSIHDAVLTMAYTLEVTAVIVIARGLLFGRWSVTALHLLFALPVLLSFRHINSSAWDTGVIHPDFFALAILMSVLLVLGSLMYARSRTPESSEGEHLTSVILMSGGVVYVFLLTALVNEGIFTHSIASASSLQSSLLTVAYIFEIAGIILFARAFRFGEQAVTSLHLLFVVPIIMSFAHLGSQTWNTSVIHPDFFAIVTLISVLAISGVVLLNQGKVNGNDTQVQSGGLLVMVSGLFGLSLIWLIFHALFSDDIGTMFTLTIYTILGLFMFFEGKMKEHKEVTLSGGILLGFVVLRLLLVDVWAMDLVGRIITFVVIGVLLISTAFMGNSKGRIETQVID